MRYLCFLLTAFFCVPAFADKTNSNCLITGAELRTHIYEWLEPGSYKGKDCVVEVINSRHYFIVGVYQDSGKSVYISANPLTSVKDIGFRRCNDTADINSRLFDMTADGDEAISVDQIRIKRIPCSTKYKVIGFHTISPKTATALPLLATWSVTCEIDTDDHDSGD